jgi:hypothetical protein
MMRQRRQLWLLVALVGLLLCGVLWWTQLRVPEIVIPPRQYPPNNAYDAYKQIAQAMYDQRGQDRRLYDIERQLFSGQEPNPAIPEADKRYYLQRRRPFLETYRKHLDQPCKAVFEYAFDWPLHELAMFRQIAQIESVLIDDALAAGRKAEAMQRLHDLMRFSEQIRTDGALVHYLVGSSMIEIGLRPIRQRLTQIQSPETLDTLIGLARRYEQRRALLKNAIQHEYYFGLAIHRDIASGKIKPDDIKAMMFNITFNSGFERWFYESDFGLRLTWRRSLLELQQYYESVFTELEKPLWERKIPALNPKQRINQMFLPGLDLAGDKELTELATVRLLGCYAAVKRYYQQHKAYPPSLEALRSELSEMIIDPFTGKPFVYRADPKRGFQIYSVGANRADDGGRVSIVQGQGDLPPITINALPKTLRPEGNWLSPPVWLR